MFISDMEKNENFCKMWPSQCKHFFNGLISMLGFTPEKFFHLELKEVSKEIPRGPMWAVPQTPPFTTNLSPAPELLAVMEVLNELGFLQKQRHAPHVKPIIKT